MNSPKLRILYVPNEEGSFRQLGFRRPFSNLVQAGLLQEVSVFSLQWRILNGGEAEEHRQNLIRRVVEFQPDIVLMQHLGRTGLREKHFRAMRRGTDFKLIYHEADPYSRFLHPLPLTAGIAGKFADVVFTVGTGDFARNFERRGAIDVRWSPHVFEPERYQYTPIDKETERTHDIVMVANRNTPRFRGLPNWRDRIRFVEYMQNRFTDRFAIFGRGWEGPSAKGPIDFSEQNQAIRSGWISANWDHFANEPSYFSNRLPISLSVGSIHATGMHPCYKDIFDESKQKYLLFEQTHEALADRIESFLEETSIAERLKLAEAAQQFAFKNYRQDNQLVNLLNFAGEVVNLQLAKECWDIASNYIEEL